MAVLGIHLVRFVLLPNDAERGPIYPKADIICLAADRDVADSYLAEAVASVSDFCSQRFVLFIIDDCN